MNVERKLRYKFDANCGTGIQKIQGLDSTKGSRAGTLDLTNRESVPKAGIQRNSHSGGENFGWY
jgi:hypothetical protein